jgi:hypothetical protein
MQMALYVKREKKKTAQQDLDQRGEKTKIRSTHPKAAIAVMS